MGVVNKVPVDVSDSKINKAAAWILPSERSSWLSVGLTCSSSPSSPKVSNPDQWNMPIDEQQTKGFK